MSVIFTTVRLPSGHAGHEVGQTYLYGGRKCSVKFVRRLAPVGGDHFIEEMELVPAEEAA